MIVSSFNTSSPILSVVHLFCLFTLPLNSMLIQYSRVGSRVAGCKALSRSPSPLEIKITHARFPPPSTCRLLVRWRVPLFHIHKRDRQHLHFATHTPSYGMTSVWVGVGARLSKYWCIRIIMLTPFTITDINN